MKRLLGVACFSIALGFGGVASAQVVDLSTIKCKDFFEKTSKDDIGFTLAWMHGYYRDENDPPIIDFDKVKADIGKLAAYCATNPTVGIITAADELFEK